jgi:hypothetical protein
MKIEKFEFVLVRIAHKAKRKSVMPVKTGIQGGGGGRMKQALDSGLRRNDDKGRQLRGEGCSVLHSTLRE